MQNIGENLDYLLDYTNGLLNDLQENKRNISPHVFPHPKLQGHSSAPKIADFRFARQQSKIQNKQIMGTLDENNASDLEESDQKVIALAKAWNLKKEQILSINNPFKELNNKMNFVQADLSSTCKKLFELDKNVAAQKANAYILRTANINLDSNQREFRKDNSCSPGPELRSIRADYGKKINLAKPLRSLSPGENRSSKAKLMLEIAAVANSKNYHKAPAQNENMDPRQAQFSPRGSTPGNKKIRSEYLPQNTSATLNVSNNGAIVQSPRGNATQNNFRNPKRNKSKCPKQAEGVSSYKNMLDESKTNVSKKSKKQKHKESRNDSNSDGPESIFIDLNQLISGDMSIQHYQNDSSKVSSVVGSFVETEAVPKGNSNGSKSKHNKWIKEATNSNASKTPHIKIQILNTKQESQTPTALERKYSEYLVNQKSPKNSSKVANENERVGSKDMYQNNKEVFDFGDNYQVKVTSKPTQNREYTPETPKGVISSNWPREQRSPQRNRMDRSTSAKDVRRLEKKQMSDAKKKKAAKARKESPSNQEKKDRNKEPQKPLVQLVLVTSDKKTIKRPEKVSENRAPVKKPAQPLAKDHLLEDEIQLVSASTNPIDSLYEDICKKLNHERALNQQRR